MTSSPPIPQASRPPAPDHLTPRQFLQNQQPSRTPVQITPTPAPRNSVTPGAQLRAQLRLSPVKNAPNATAPPLQRTPEVHIHVQQKRPAATQPTPSRAAKKQAIASPTKKNGSTPKKGRTLPWKTKKTSKKTKKASKKVKKKLNANRQIVDNNENGGSEVVRVKLSRMP